MADDPTPTTAAYRVDWERRRVLPASGNSTCCVHGGLLVEFCPDCGIDLDVLAAEKGAA